MNVMTSLKKLAAKALSLALDAIAPKDPYIAMIAEMGHEGFDEKAAKCDPAVLFDGIICLYSYKDPMVKKVVLQVKSHADEDMAEILGQAVYEKLSVLANELSLLKPLLIPIPMTRTCERKRGWNQCEIIAAAAKRRDARDLFDLSPRALKKIRETEDQVGKGRLERFENLKDCFEAHEEVRGRDTIVIDDIATTGATLKEARRALEKGGARNILCVALAH